MKTDEKYAAFGRRECRMKKISFVSFSVFVLSRSITSLIHLEFLKRTSESLSCDYHLKGDYVKTSYSLSIFDEILAFSQNDHTIWSQNAFFFLYLTIIHLHSH